jgi:hypothetical protein
LIFFVDPGQPIWPVTRSLNRVDHRVGFQNYGSCTHWSNKTVNSGDWVLNSNCKLPISIPTVETLWVIRKFSTVVVDSPYTRFLSGPPDNPASNYKSKSKIQVDRRIVLISLLQPAITCLLEIKKWNHQIQENNNLRNKMVENQCTVKCWARLSTNCYTLFWRSSLCTCVSIKSSIGLSSLLSDVACKKKNVFS